MTMGKREIRGRESDYPNNIVAKGCYGRSDRTRFRRVGIGGSRIAVTAHRMKRRCATGMADRPDTLMDNRNLI